jgi:hypothetical protein
MRKKIIVILVRQDMLTVDPARNIVCRNMGKKSFVTFIGQEMLTAGSVRTIVCRNMGKKNFFISYWSGDVHGRFHKDCNVSEESRP